LLTLPIYVGDEEGDQGRKEGRKARRKRGRQANQSREEGGGQWFCQ
jgi:hypothetical protein